MIVSRRINIAIGKCDSAHLLDRMQEYFRNNVEGKVLRFAIVEVKGKDLVVDASIKMDKNTLAGAKRERKTRRL